MAQSVERHIGNVEVTSSILVSSFFYFTGSGIPGSFFVIPAGIVMEMGIV